MAKVTDFGNGLCDRYGLSAEEADGFIAAMFDVVDEELNSPEKQVKIKGLGTFKVTSVGARASVNVNTGERIMLEGRNKITFTPETMLRDRVNRPFVQFETVVLNDGVDFSEIDREYREQQGKDQTPACAMDDDAQATDETTPGTEMFFKEQGCCPDGSTTREASAEEEEAKNDESVKDDKSASEDEALNDGESAKEDKPLNDGESAKEDEAPNDGESARANDSVNDVEPVKNGEPANHDKPGDDDNPSKFVVVGACRQRNPRLMYWLTAASFVLLVCIGISICLLYRQIEEKNAAIEQLQSRLASHAESMKAAAMKNQPAKQTMPQRTPPSENDSAKKESNTDGGIRKSQASNSKDNTQAQPTPAITASSDYNYDVRIRTGAYIIVGTEKVVTVRPGQTLASISKANLGPGMECYVEVYNNRKEVRQGDKLKIPKLKIKPRR